MSWEESLTNFASIFCEFLSQEKFISKNDNIAKLLAKDLSKEDLKTTLTTICNILESSEVVTKKNKMEIKNRSDIKIPKPKGYKRMVFDADSVLNASPIPLCIPNDCEYDSVNRRCKILKGVTRNRLILNEDALAMIEKLEGKVCVISIAGRCRSGKSYILNRLIGKLGGGGFSLGHTVDPETMGIWTWGSPLKRKIKVDGKIEEVNIILVDTEGIDAVGASANEDNKIFILSVLMSSLLIYNSLNVPTANDLDKLNFITQLSKSIQVKSGEKQQYKHFSNHFPDFLWLLRDVILTPTNGEGKEITFKEYLLDNVLDIEKMDYDADKQKSVARALLSFFQSFDCFALPPPTANTKEMENIETSEKLNSDFLDQVDKLITRIFLNVKPKTGYVSGSFISGFRSFSITILYYSLIFNQYFFYSLFQSGKKLSIYITTLFYK